MAYNLKEGDTVKIVNAPDKYIHLVGTTTTIYHVYTVGNDDPEPYKLAETGDVWWPEHYFTKVGASNAVNSSTNITSLSGNTVMYELPEGKVIDNGNALLFIPADTTTNL